MKETKEKDSTTKQIFGVYRIPKEMHPAILKIIKKSELQNFLEYAVFSKRSLIGAINNQDIEALIDEIDKNELWLTFTTFKDKKECLERLKL